MTKLIQTNKNGIPDLLALKKGVVIFLEVKRKDKKPTPLQTYLHDELMKCGVAVYVVTDVEELYTLGIIGWV